MPFLPVKMRPNVITTKDGVQLSVDKVKVEGKERILKRGNVCILALGKSRRC